MTFSKHSTICSLGVNHRKDSTGGYGLGTGLTRMTRQDAYSPTPSPRMGGWMLTGVSDMRHVVIQAHYKPSTALQAIHLPHYPPTRPNLFLHPLTEFL